MALSLVAAAAAALMALGLGAQAAEAYDAYPCDTPRTRNFVWHGYTYPRVVVMTCPLWTGNVPVRAYNSPRAPVVGKLVQGGSANWFVVEKRGDRQSVSGATNIYWASTMADNGAWGWVSEVYFRGGGNDEDDRGLLFPGPMTCSTPCPPSPPWH
jgi:hypothetical protein